MSEDVSIHPARKALKTQTKASIATQSSHQRIAVEDQRTTSRSATAMVDSTKHVLAIPISKSCRSLRPSPEMLVMLLVDTMEKSSACCFVLDLAEDRRYRKEKRPLSTREEFTL